MKVNVPEKIYLDKNNITLLDMLSVKDTERIEYTCTDTFIEKALEWIRKEIRPYYSDVKYKYEDFKRYIEG